MFSRDQLNSLFHYCLSLTAERASAEDLLHSGIEQLLKSRNNIQNPMAYARRTMRNQFTDDCRRNKRVEFEPLEDHQPVLLAENDFEQLIIDRDHIDKLMALLSSAEREVLFLWAVEGYSAAEIAQQIDSPRGTILAKLFRIRQKIKKIENSNTETMGALR